jgi:hypothetical protein
MKSRFMVQLDSNKVSYPFYQVQGQRRKYNNVYCLIQDRKMSSVFCFLLKTIFHSLVQLETKCRKHFLDLVSVIPALYEWGLICCRFCLALCRPLQLYLLSAEGRAPSNTAKTSDFFFLSYVYNQFLCSLTCTNTPFFSRTLEYLAVFIIYFT